MEHQRQVERIVHEEQMLQLKKQLVTITEQLEDPELSDKCVRPRPLSAGGFPPLPSPSVPGPASDWGRPEAMHARLYAAVTPAPPPPPLRRHGPVQAPERALNGCVQDLLGGRYFVWS